LEVFSFCSCSRSTATFMVKEIKEEILLDKKEEDSDKEEEVVKEV
jgi:hypothetical protein